MRQTIVEAVLALVLLVGAGYGCYHWGQTSRDSEVKTLTDSNMDLENQLKTVQGTIDGYKAIGPAVDASRAKDIKVVAAQNAKLEKIDRAITTLKPKSSDPCVNAQDVAKTYFDTLKSGDVK